MTAIMSLADHIFTDLQDRHTEMYLEFLHDLQLSDAEIQASQPSLATQSYQYSFIEEFGYSTDNFNEAMAALSGRELCVSIRNQIFLQSYFEAKNIKQPTWLSLHAELEMDHFQDAILPVLTHYSYMHNSTHIADLIQVIQQSIHRHIQYFEELLIEYESQM